MSNYLRSDICSNPKHIQSIFINSFINYGVEENKIIEKNGRNNYYRFQKDIVTFMACENDKKEIKLKNPTIFKNLLNKDITIFEITFQYI